MADISVAQSMQLLQHPQRAPSIAQLVHASRVQLDHDDVRPGDGIL